MSSPAPSQAIAPILPRELVVVVASGTARGRRLRLPARARISPHADADLTIPELGPTELELTRSPAHVTFTNPVNGDLVATVHDDGITLGTLQVLALGGCSVHLRAELDQRNLPASDSPHFADLVGPSPAMRSLFGVLEQVVQSDAALLIEGEVGTGKSTIARAVHHQSHRHGPLVVVDCSSIGCDVIEEELFGAEGQAPDSHPFSPPPADVPPESVHLPDSHHGDGQTHAPRGAFRLAAGGTLLLADVDDLPLALQARLTTELLSRATNNIRVIATSRRSLQLEVERGKFSQELLLALSGVAVSIPPLRSRRDDIPALVEHFLHEARKLGTDVTELPEGSLSAVLHHDWPGNVAELAGVVGRFVDRDTDRVLPIPAPLTQDGSDPVPAFDVSSTYRETRGIFEANFERRYIRWLLLRHRGNISAAAREARMDRKHLYDLARRHGLRGERPSSVPPSSRER